MKKIIRYTGIFLLLVILTIGGYVLIYYPPVMAGMVAKTMCSCVYVMERTEESVREKELAVFPGLSSASVTFHPDKTVSASFLGRTRVAVYRDKIGCTLVAERSADEIKNTKLPIPPPPPFNQDSITWPTGNIVADTLLPGVDYDKLNEVVTRAFSETPDKPLNTHAVVVVYNGEIIAEQYAEGITKDSRLMGWSMTKSISNALIGILAKENKLSMLDRVPFDHWKDDARGSIRIENLMQATSGLQWEEGYFNPRSDFHQMFMFSDDKGGYAAQRPAASEPGTVFEYSSGTTNMLSKLIRQTVGDDEYYSFMYEKLFHKIGMHHAIIEPDASGTYVMSSYGYATARDWARLGLLYLNDGMWGNERILPESWVEYSTTPSTAAKLGEYGAQIWLNRGSKDDPANCYFPGVPHDAWLFSGFEENFVVMIPSKNLVVVRLGVTHQPDFTIATLVNDVIAALEPNE